MANTTNFGWETPDDTDLVKDGAAAMRTLGNSIDTSLVDLKGGTTGQVLAKASNTDMDFTWATDASGISATIFDAKGDIIAASAADTAARLAVGTNGQVLKANSATATGLEWGAVSATKNYVLVNTGGTSLNGSASTTISGLAGYDDLLIYIQNASSATASSRLEVYFNSVQSDYNSQGFQITGSSSYNGADFTSSNAGGNSRIELAQMSSASASVMTAYLKIEGANTAGNKIFHYAGGANANVGNSQILYARGGFWGNTATIDSITVASSTGNFDAGTVRVFGAA
jgi:hypothetical protein